MKRKLVVMATATCAMLMSAVLADTVTLKNGDKITGTVGTISGSKMAFKSAVLGDITIDLANVETYSTDEPATIRLKSQPAPINDKITAANATKIDTAGGKTLQTGEVKVINPAAEKWTGAIQANGALARGNTDTLDIGVKIDAALRRDNGIDDDRFTLGGAYNFGNTGRGDAVATTTDNWHAMGKYDKFWNEKLYGYVNLGVDHDRVANLNFRVTPGVGLGYQWIESPDMNFNTEAGISYVYEDNDPGDTNKFIAARLAYHFDKKLYDGVTLFHNLEYLPAFEDPGDYIVTTDVGVRAKLTASFFTEARVELKRDSTPPDGAFKNDLRYILGIGWAF